MSIEIKLTPLYRVEVFENGKRCTFSHGNDYARTEEEAYKLGLSIFKSSKALDYATDEILKGNHPKIYSAPY